MLDLKTIVLKALKSSIQSEEAEDRKDMDIPGLVST